MIEPVYHLGFIQRQVDISSMYEAIASQREVFLHLPPCMEEVGIVGYVEYREEVCSPRILPLILLTSTGAAR